VGLTGDLEKALVEVLSFREHNESIKSFSEESRGKHLAEIRDLTDVVSKNANEVRFWNCH
jgi:hypothetical protein